MIFHYSFAFPEHTHFEAGSGSEHFFFFLACIGERFSYIWIFHCFRQKSTQSFLSANGCDVIDDPIEGFIRWSLL